MTRGSRPSCGATPVRCRPMRTNNPGTHRPSKRGPMSLLDRFDRRQAGMAEETNPAFRGLRLLALLRRGEDLSGLDQAGDIGCHDRWPAAFQHLANQPACGFLLSLDRVPHVKGKTSSPTDDPMYLPQPQSHSDERVAVP